MSRLERLREELEEIRNSSGEKRKSKFPRRPPYVSLETDSERLVGLRGSVSGLLQEINWEVLDGRGEFIDWQETITSRHSHGGSRWAGGDEWFHSTKQLETRLLIPEVGELIVFAPLQGTQKIGFSASYFRVLSIGLRDRGGKGTLCDRVGRKISLGYKDDLALERLTEFLVEECVRIHKSALS